jgi:hypothetical protein
MMHPPSQQTRNKTTIIRFMLLDSTDADSPLENAQALDLFRVVAITCSAAVSHQLYKLPMRMTHLPRNFVLTCNKSNPCYAGALGQFSQFTDQVLTCNPGLMASPLGD